MTTPDVEKRAKKYFAKKNLEFASCLGAGTQGSVYVCNLPSRCTQSKRQVAVKIHDREIAYVREIIVYERLRDLEVTHVGGHRVPILIDSDEELLAIEMTIVSPPFCLDFGGAYLDNPPDYSLEVWQDWERMKSEDFGENWPHVKTILASLEAMGIHVADVNPGNIKFE